MNHLEYICADVWGRARDGSLWLDVPARMVALGLDTDDRSLRQRFAREGMRELRRGGKGLIVARVNGMRHR